ncbi:hypothetical protein JCM30471_31110 [Desulfuromonas carbonis]|uniref:hypothetical protein n=1 Tax=Desulfuromonas sp. DDH964 TaxID=1823759 RepID=UPI00078EC60B|nr:hypothetical protein [Desulfuromonas sp. DDH964]AMV71273.1 hypothetical protein DBW_0891 [Desulfuromonas sp. DDH964]
MNCLLKIPVLLSLTILAVACGGGGGGGGDNAPAAAPSSTMVGSFIDSPVDGLTYRTPSQSGNTNSSGEFTYKKGEFIEFFLGKTRLGQTLARSVVTPVDLFLGASLEDKRVVNLARLLQTLDLDSDPTNGITLGSGIANFDQALDFAQESSLISALGAFDASLSLKDSAAAKSHMAGSLDSVVADMPEATFHSILIDPRYSQSNQCVAYTGATLAVGKNSGGETTLSGVATRTTGETESFTATYTNGLYTRMQSVPENAAISPVDLSIKVETYKAEIFWKESPTCAGFIVMSIDDALNYPPTAHIGPAYQIPNVAGTPGVKDVLVFYGAGSDSDGYVTENYLTTTDFNAGPPVSHAIPYTFPELSGYQFTWEYTLDGVVQPTENVDRLLRVEKFPWESAEIKLTVYDNENAATTVTKTIPATGTAPVTLGSCTISSGSFPTCFEMSGTGVDTAVFQASCNAQSGTYSSAVCNGNFFGSCTTTTSGLTTRFYYPSTGYPILDAELSSSCNLNGGVWQ